MTNNNEKYWESKINAFLHDPADKVLRIQGHEERAKKIAEALGARTAIKEEVQKSDVMASGLDRAAMPKYNPDDKKNGAIDYPKHPVLTHPISGGKELGIHAQFKDANSVTDEIVKLIKKDTEDKNTRWSRQEYFNYLFLF